MNRILLAGTPEFATRVFRPLIEQRRGEIVAVITQPDRPAGRGRRLRPPPVKELAQEHGLPVLQPESLRDAEAQEQIAHLKPDVMLVVAFGQLLPPSLLEIPPHGCLNVHASLLPRWRGAAPIQRAILAGDRETGVTLMRMVEALDAGPILARLTCPIVPEDTAATLHDRLADLGARCLQENLDAYLAGRLPPREQDESKVTYAEKIRKEEARIDWNRPASHIERQVRAFNPWPVARCTLLGLELKIWLARAVAEPAGAPPGTPLGPAGEGFEIATGEGRLRILRLQQAGRRPVEARAFLNAHPEFAGHHP